MSRRIVIEMIETTRTTTVVSEDWLAERSLPVNMHTLTAGDHDGELFEQIQKSGSDLEGSFDVTDRSFSAEFENNTASNKATVETNTKDPDLSLHEQDLQTIRNFMIYFADELGGRDQVADTINRLNEELNIKMDSLEPDSPEDCENCRANEELQSDPDTVAIAPTKWWHCQHCQSHLDRFKGQGDISCFGCGAQYNAFGQRLRDDWAGNPSNYDDEIDDLDGYERQHAGY